MNSARDRRRGFTLIELLTVIAIIGILAAFIAVGLPRVIERAKIASLKNNFNQIRTMLATYYVDHGTYPPAYGYLMPHARGVDPALLSDADHFRRPWMDFLGRHNNTDLYDNFSIGYDTDDDDYISFLEFAPFGTVASAAIGTYDFPNILYDGSNLPGEQQRQLNTDDRRPLIYVPVNKRLFRKVSANWFSAAESNGEPSNPRPNDTTQPNSVLENMNFPPPNYDAYVLISVGPNIHTRGLIYSFLGALNDDGNGDPLLIPGNYSPAYYYHVLGMAVYFMATRDAENSGRGDGELDFDFIARGNRGQGKDPNNNVPDFNARRAPGPIIFVGE